MEDLHAAIATYLREQRRRPEAVGQCRHEPPPREIRQVAIYVRAATMTQTDRAILESQVASCRAYAALHGQADPLIYREVMGGDTLERPRLAELRAAIVRGRIGTVLITTFERLTRDPVLLAALRAEWGMMGVAIVAVMGEP